MATGTGAAPARARTAAKPLRAEDLPIRVPLIHGETTASLLLRTATANGAELNRLIKALHHGRLTLPKAGVEPQWQEVLMSAASADRLATLLGRTVDQLQRALPSLRVPRLLDESAAAVSLKSWTRAIGSGPLKACPLCMEEGAWLVADGRRWRPCPCGRRWMGGDEGGYVLDTGPLPDLSRALVQHRALDHRLGPAGDALVADAHQVALWWWINNEVAHEAWREREDTLGCSKHRRRAAPTVVYPETMVLAEAMSQWEQQRHQDDAAPAKWLEELAARFEVPAIADGRERKPLNYWLQLHPAGAGASGSTAAERRWEQLPPLHHRPAEPGPWQAVSCLRWVFRLPLTSTTEVCPHCNGRDLSCLWVPSADCLKRPATT